jgi:hypothetical protein
MKSYETIYRILRIGAFLGIVFLIWYGAIFLAVHSEIPEGAKMGDMAQLLFGAAAFATFILSILFAVAAVVGWQKINDYIDAQVKAAFDRERESYDQEIKGRHYAASGLVSSALAYDPVSFKVTSRAGLEEAIRHFKVALKEFPHEKDYHATILNNLVFSLCLRNSKTDRAFVLASVDKLLSAGFENGRRFMILTACRALFQYSSDSVQIRMAKEILRELRSNTHEGILESEKGEAGVHLAWLRLHRPNM